MVAFFALEVDAETRSFFNRVLQRAQRARVALLDSLQTVSRIGGEEPSNIFRVGERSCIHQDAAQEFDKANRLSGNEVLWPPRRRPETPDRPARD